MKKLLLTLVFIFFLSFLSLVISLVKAQNTMAPTIIGFSTATKNASCTFRIKWNAAGSYYIFGWNGTGSWVNDTPLAFTGLWTNITKTLPNRANVTVAWRVWVNDTNNNWVDTGLQYLKTVDVYSRGAVTGYANDIQAAINDVASHGGGNVYLPFGKFEWKNEQVTYDGPYDINIIGYSRAGCKGHEDGYAEYNASTILHINNIIPAPMFYFGGQGHYPNVYGRVTVSNIQFESVGPRNSTEENWQGNNAILMQQIPNFRISYCTFINFSSSAIEITANDGLGPYANVSSWGVIDHNVITAPYKKSPPPDDPNDDWYWAYGIIVTGDGHEGCWNETNAPITNFWGKYGFVSHFSIVYIEDNHISYSRHHIASSSLGYYVARFNLLDYPACGYTASHIDVHGAAFPGGRGGEFYNNTIIGAPKNEKPWRPGDTYYSTAIGLRGGASLVYNNTFITDTYSPYNYFISLSNDPYEGREYQYVNQTYIWSNTYTNCRFLNNQDSDHIHENIEYFLRAPTLQQDGIEYKPYPYPHPLTLEGEITSQPQLEYPVNITGIVTDQETGLPIQGATVTCNDYSDTTNSTGGYFIAISAPAPGSCNLTANKSGYMTKSISFSFPSNGTYVRNFTLELIKFKIAGRLTDKNNQPVQANIIIYQQGTNTIITTNQTVNGYYTLSVTPAVYDIQFNISNFYIKLLSIDVGSDVNNIINYISYDSSKLSFTAGITKNQTIIVYSQEPSRALLNTTPLTRVSSLAELTSGSWFYESNKLYLIANPELKVLCPYSCCKNELIYYDKPCQSGYYCSNRVCLPTFNTTVFHATFDNWSTTNNCEGASAEGWDECQLGEATLYWRAVAGLSPNTSSTHYHEANDIDTNNATWLTKCLDLSQYSNAYVAFWYNKTATNAENERHYILVNKTGLVFTSLWSSTTSATGWTYKELDISSYISPQTCVRYMAGAVSATTERLLIDDFKIVASL